VIRDCIGLAVCDMAGTTLAVTDAVPIALRRAFGEAGVDLTESSIEAVRGQSKREAIAGLLQQSNAAGRGPADLVEQVFASFRRELVREYERGVSPVAGADHALRFLRAEGIRVVLTTGFDRDLALELIRKVGWTSDLVDGLVSADDVTRGRPDPAMILRAMELTAVTTPGRVLVIGDTRADLEAARAAGVGVAIGVLTGAHSREHLAGVRHTAILDGVADLPAWLEAYRC